MGSCLSTMHCCQRYHVDTITTISALRHQHACSSTAHQRDSHARAIHVPQVCHGLSTACSSSPLQVVCSSLVVPHNTVCADVEQRAYSCLSLHIAAVCTVLIVLQYLTLAIWLDALRSTQQAS